jgi:hypothetical protein
MPAKLIVLHEHRLPVWYGGINLRRITLYGDVSHLYALTLLAVMMSSSSIRYIETSSSSSVRSRWAWQWVSMRAICVWFKISMPCGVLAWSLLLLSSSSLSVTEDRDRHSYSLSKEEAGRGCPAKIGNRDRNSCFLHSCRINLSTSFIEKGIDHILKLWQHVKSNTIAPCSNTCHGDALSTLAFFYFY